MPEVKPLPLPETPACPTKIHGEAVGSYRYADAPEPTDGVSKPPSASVSAVAASVFVARSLTKTCSPCVAHL